LAQKHTASGGFPILVDEPEQIGGGARFLEEFLSALAIRSAIFVSGIFSEIRFSRGSAICH
jgi:hypothetical protein